MNTLLNSFTLKPVLKGWFVYFIPPNTISFTEGKVPKNLVNWREKFDLFIKIIINGVTFMNVRRFHVQVCMHLCTFACSGQKWRSIVFANPSASYSFKYLLMSCYVHVWVSAHILVQLWLPNGHRAKNRVLGSVELKIQVFVCSLMVVLGIQVGFSTKAASDSNCWAISLVPSILLFSLNLTHCLSLKQKPTYLGRESSSKPPESLFLSPQNSDYKYMTPCPLSFYGFWET